jgi:plastocyanin
MKKALSLLVLALSAIAIVACGSNSGTTTETETEASSGAAAGESEAGGEPGGAEAGGSASTVEIEADPGGALAYTQKEVTAKAGNVTIDFTNPQALGHDVTVESSGGEKEGKTEIVTEGSSNVTLEGLKPGKYTFYCSVPGHREAGMEGTLTVK